MEPRVSLITLGVTDLARSRAFYEALGWRGQEVEGTWFVQAGPQAIVLWSSASLADDAGVPPAGEGFGGVALAQNVRTPGEVDVVIDAARSAGATVTRGPATTFYGGYAGYFADLDGHLWEVSHNPGFTLTDEGFLVLPDFGG
jgi:catechol 2,3-dioxygenase-like lactoylglutathione lyase family enzyme